jgi:hypothetical protein
MLQTKMNITPKIVQPYSSMLHIHNKRHTDFLKKQFYTTLHNGNISLVVNQRHTDQSTDFAVSVGVCCGLA